MASEDVTAAGEGASSAGAAYTLVGMLDDEAPARVDGVGFVTGASGRWTLEWWVRDADRWRRPSSEASIRQRRLGPGPVVETALRVSGGDVVARVHPAPLRDRSPGADRATVVELENLSSTPVAVAFVLRGRVGSGRIGFDIAETAILVNGQGVSGRVELPRRPNEAGVLDAVPEHLPAGLGDCLQAGYSPDCAMVVYPLPHTARLRVAMVAEPARAGDHSAVEIEHAVTQVDLASLVSTDQAVAGWRQLVDANGRVTLADPGMTDRAAAARSRLLLGTPEIVRALLRWDAGAGTALAALATSGALTEALRMIRALVETVPPRRGMSPDTAAELVMAVGRIVELGGDPALADEVLGWLVGLARRADRSPALGAVVGDGLARAARAAGQVEVGDELVRERGVAPLMGSMSIDELVAFMETASGTGAFGADELGAAARMWLGVRSVLVSDDSSGVLDLLPRFPTAWRGGTVDVHDLATAAGAVSFAIRWHGPRPALLWGLEPLDPSGPPVLLRCSGLDPLWSTSALSGDVLLAGASDVLPPTPGPGDSFS